MTDQTRCDSTLKLMYGSVRCDFIPNHDGLHQRSSWTWDTRQGEESWSIPEDCAE